MWAQILSIVALFNNLFSAFKAAWAAWKKQKRRNWEEEKSEVEEALLKATTAEDKKRLAKKLADLTARIPS